MNQNGVPAALHTHDFFSFSLLDRNLTVLSALKEDLFVFKINPTGLIIIRL